MLEAHYGKIWIEGNIICGTFSQNVVINLNVAKDMVKDRLMLSEGKPYLILVEIDKIKAVENKARSYFASTEGTRQLIAAALIANSYLSRIIGNFFLTFNKPLIPTRLFTDREEARQWLRQYAID